MKKTRMVLWLFICILVFSQGIYSGKAEAADSKVEITISENRVANLFYQVTINDKPIIEDVTYEIKDWSGKITYKGGTDKSFIRLEQVPYGKYNIIITTKEGNKYEFPIDVNSEYVKTQHEIKYLKLEEIKKVNTGDENNWKNYMWFLMISAGLIIYMLFKNPSQKKGKVR